MRLIPKSGPRMGLKEQAVRATLPSRPAAILYKDTALRRRLNRCFAGLFDGAVQGRITPNGGLSLGNPDCERDWQKVWPAMKELGLVEYSIEEVIERGVPSRHFYWNITDKGHQVREDALKYFRELMEAMAEERDRRPALSLVPNLH